jgi:hypothetical protein
MDEEFYFFNVDIDVEAKSKKEAIEKVKQLRSNWLTIYSVNDR